MENEKIENDMWFAGTSPRYKLQAANRGERAMHPFGKGGMVTFYPKEGWSVPNWFHRQMQRLILGFVGGTHGFG